MFRADVSQGIKEFQLFRLRRRSQERRFGAFPALHPVTFRGAALDRRRQSYRDMRDDDSDDLQLARRRIDLQVEVARPLIRKQDSRLAIECARKEEPLPLTA